MKDFAVIICDLNGESVFEKHFDTFHGAAVLYNLLDSGQYRDKRMLYMADMVTGEIIESQRHGPITFEDIIE